MSKRRKTKRKIALAFVVIVLAVAGFWMFDGVQPVAAKGAGAKVYIRYESSKKLGAVLNELQRRGVVRNAFADHLLALVERRSETVPAGSYSVNPGMNGEAILRQLRTPVFFLLRLPETDWANRTAHLLQEHQIVDADEYMALVHHPEEFANDVSFPLPKESLEGYLYPERYELPPLAGARHVIVSQLKEFERNVWNGLDKPKDLRRTLILASLVQLEAGTDVDRPMIAGVIENRLKKKMPLQIDATILYGIQKWRRLTFKDYHSIKSPYNTYLFKGLPLVPSAHRTQRTSRRRYTRLSTTTFITSPCQAEEPSTLPRTKSTLRTWPLGKPRSRS